MKKIFFLISLISAAAFQLQAQSPQPGKAPAAEDTMRQLENSPRHGEWVTIDAGRAGKVLSWVVYPERSSPAPVVIVIHEIFGLNDWARAVADQFAAEGFIAVAPDFLSGKGVSGGGSSTLSQDKARELMGTLQKEEIFARLDSVLAYGKGLPSSSGKTAVVGYCWGGGISFDYAAHQKNLDAAVVYYGVSPETSRIAAISAPVLGLYGGNDNRVNSTIPDAQKEAERRGKEYTVIIYPDAGHAFLRNQSGSTANAKAADAAWPETVRFLREKTEK